MSAILRGRASRIGAAMVVGLLALVLGVSILSPYPSQATTGPANSPPSLSHPFGTTYLGQDVMTQLAWGSFSSLFVGFFAALIASLLGFLVGILSGYYGRLGVVLGAATDIILTLPNIVVLLIIGSFFNLTDAWLMVALAVFLWPSVARGIRAQVQSLVNRSYVDASRTSGMSYWQIILRTLTPKVGAIGVAYFVFNVALSIVIVTALQFLGVGNPGAVSWGSMLYFAQQYGIYLGDWWWVLAPGLAITIFATGFALVGFSLEEIMNPRLRMK